MDVVHDAAEFLELALLEHHSGVRLRKLAAKSIELFGALPVSAYQVADGPAPDETDARRQDAEQSCGVVVHADFSRVVAVCSRSTRWMVVRETR